MDGIGREGWSVFDRVKPFPASPTPAPNALMADIEAAVAATEYANSTAFLRPMADPLSPEFEGVSISPKPAPPAGLADEAYRSACAALAAGKPDSALRSLHVALAYCPREKKSALSRLRSLFAYAVFQQQRLPGHRNPS